VLTKTPPEKDLSKGKHYVRSKKRIVTKNSKKKGRIGCGEESLRKPSKRKGGARRVGE